MSFMSFMASTAHELWYSPFQMSMKELEKDELNLENQELSIKQHGFQWIRPIGINKTMQEQAELGEREAEAGNVDTEIDEEELRSDDFPQPNEQETQDVDLDADVTNADASEFYDEMSDFDFQG
ncbi:anaphase-promoting complex subunit Apc15 [Schizosaccharomyces octosporus yFS286]|uniref:Anaphase-promoting complex subunit Apc15 n=1 Tax=Schizosaccharomyces octosporus (strain yFS286) TaxID=483514 RepID=S9RDW4_SCHOY|nr:anaphase-promoting complex subunit Apc15 [Schizosaccharomyces octosporus yFS286]EPX72269.1 anaphase-promoting complex subunit Apc15 [Schizosaccharomyces octosporus yFS286]